MGRRSARGLIVLLMAVALTAACNKQSRESGAGEVAGQPPVFVISEQPCGAPVPDTDAAAAGDSADAPNAATAPPGPSNNSSSLERHWQESLLELKEPISISLELRSAEFNPAEGADLALLHFEASSELSRHDWIYKDLELDDLQDTDSATLQLDLASLELQPLLQNPVVDGRTSTGGSQLRMDGGLRFIVRDPQGNPMGSFLVNSDGEIYEAENGEGYSWRISETDDQFIPAQYLFYRTVQPGETIHYLFAVSYRNGAMSRSIVKDPLGNEITYLFPNGSVEIAPPPDPAKKKRDPNAEARR